MRTASRREFLKQITVGATAVGTASLGGFAAGAAPAGAKARYAICNETFQGWTQEKVFAFSAQCGYRGIEIAPFTIANDVRSITAAEAPRCALRRTKPVSRWWRCTGCWPKTEGLHLTSPDAAVRRKTSEYLAELARFCRDLGGTILVFGSPKQRNLPAGVSREQGMDYAAEVFRAAIPALAETGVTLALEPLAPSTTNFLTTADQAVELAQRVDDPHCRLHLDCLAMASEPTPMADLIRKHQRWLVHFHANDPNQRGPGMGRLDFEPIFGALGEIGYGGWVSVEVFDYSPGGEAIARQSIEYMRKVDHRA